MNLGQLRGSDSYAYPAVCGHAFCWILLMPSHVLICLFLDLPSPQSWRSCLCTQGAVVPKKFSPAALCTLVKLSTHHTSFPSQERSWQASSVPHCSIIGKGHTGKVSLTLSYASKLAFPPLQQNIWTSPLDTENTKKKKPAFFAQVSAPQVFAEYS